MRKTRAISWVSPSRRASRSEPRRRLPLGELAVVVALLVLGLSRPASGEAPSRIVVVDQGSAELSRKVRAEAMHVGFAVIYADAGSPAARAAAGDRELLERNKAVALVRVASEQQVEVHLARPDADAPYSETLQRRPADGESFALRVVEQVRARLVELNLMTEEQPTSSRAATTVADAAPAALPDSPPPAASPAPQADRGAGAPSAAASPAFWIAAGVAGTLPSGGIGPTPHVLLGARFEPDPASGIGAFALLPLIQNDVEAPEGEAEVNVTAFAAQLEHAPIQTKDWIFSGGLGGGLLVLSMRGEAAEPLVGRDDRLWTGIYFLDLSAGYRVADWLRVKATLFAGASAPRPVVRFDDHDVAAWGRLFAALAIQGEVGFAPMQGGGTP